MHPEDPSQPAGTDPVAHQPEHVPVLIEAVLDALAPRAGDIFVDCTAGLGGHSGVVAARLAEAGGGTVVINDVDPGNLERAEAHVCGMADRVLRASGAVGGAVEVVPVLGNFVGLPHQLAKRGLAADCVLADLGFSSNQMDDGQRGLSFRRDGPLDMRLDPALPESAADLVATLPEAELARIIYEYGEERRSRAVARKIVAVRAHEPITTTSQLAEIVRSVVARSPGPRPIDPATRTFQALRIAVNDELGVLAGLLDAVRRGAAALARASAEHGAGTPEGTASWLAHGARVGIISFHSLEDRAVKQAFAGLRERGHAELVTRKPIEADASEVEGNPRSRSAKLRVVRVV